MKVTSLRYLDAKFHHPSLGASPPNRGNRISCVQNSRKTENRNSVNNSGIGILCSKNSNERLAFPAVAGLLVVVAVVAVIVVVVIKQRAKDRHLIPLQQHLYCGLDHLADYSIFCNKLMMIIMLTTTTIMMDSPACWRVHVGTVMDCPHG